VYRARRCRVMLDAMGSETASKITQQNALWLCRYAERISNSKWNADEFLVKAQTWTEKDFGDWVNGQMGGAAHEEEKLWLRAELDESQKVGIDYGVEVALWKMVHAEHMPVLGKDIGGALEYALNSWLDSPCEIEGFGHLSNRELYEQRDDLTMPASPEEQEAIAAATAALAPEPEPETEQQETVAP